MDLQQIVDTSKASQNKNELLWLLKEVVPIEPRVVVEIGTWYGYSLEVWYRAFHPSILVTIENDPHALEMLNDRVRKGEFSYMEPPATGIKGNSQDQKTVDSMLDLLKDKPIDFLFIDGDHHYDAVKRDFELYSPFVRKGGIVAFHDMGLKDNPNVEVYRFWDELIATHQYKLLIDKDGTGTGIIYL